MNISILLQINILITIFLQNVKTCSSGNPVLSSKSCQNNKVKKRVSVDLITSLIASLQFQLNK